MFYSIRTRLMVGFLGVSLLVGTVSLITGVHLLNRHVIDEASNRVRLDLNAATEMYRTRIKQVRIALHITTLGYGFITSVRQQDRPDLIYRLDRLAHHAELDFAVITDADGRILGRAGETRARPDDGLQDNPLVRLALERRTAVSGSAVLNRDLLLADNPELADRARIPLAAGSGAKAAAPPEETRGLAMVGAVPIYDQDAVIGVLYGGVLLNQAIEMVDTVTTTIFRGEHYGGRSLGFAAIFLQDVRISTSVETAAGKRAVGALAPADVRRAVLANGAFWVGRTVDAGCGYITATAPIEDIFGVRIGMLQIGVQAAKYTDIRTGALAFFVLITVSGMLLAAALGYLLADKVSRPVRRLIYASMQVSEGRLDPDLGPPSRGEIGVLESTFRDMVAAMGRRRAASRDQIIHSEKQASIGRLAAGVAHEINNPLTGVLTYTHMLLRRKDLAPDVRSDLETVVNATERVRKIVKGLLDFSRQTKLDPEPTDINRLVEAAIKLVENQALVKGVAVTFNPGDQLPLVVLDRSQIQSVLINILINALDATEPEGHIRIFTATGLAGDGPGKKGIEITVADTGCGIAPEDLDRLFDPFFTTKAVGQGTGLGLSVSMGIVSHHGGHIRVQSEKGKGSRFFVWLPLNREKPSHESVSGR